MSEHRPPDQAWLLWSAGFCVLVVGVLWSRGGLPPYDDAFFFVRFARNLLEHGVYAWNPSEGPVHGNTSQLFQVAVTGVHALAGAHTVWGTRLLLGACLVLAATVHGRRWGWETGALAFAGPVALATVLSGMETGLVLALGAGFVALLHNEDTLPRPAKQAGAVVLAILLFAARPDTALLTLSSLGLWGWGAGRLRLRGLAPAVLALLGMLALLGLYRWAYGTALPLSFYLKSGLTQVYDAGFLAKSRASKLRHFALFVVACAPLGVLIAKRPARAWRVALPAGLFVAYHLAFTVDVMGLFARFFAPSLPWLAAAAALNLSQHKAGARRAWVGVGWGLFGGGIVAAVLLGWLPEDRGWAIGRVHWAVYAAAWAAGGLLLWPGPPAAALRGVGILALAGVATWVSAHDGRWRLQAAPSDRDLARGLISETTSWRGLEQLEHCLGPQIHLYHSEIGVPGVWMPEARISDLGGLMNPALALEGVDVDALCLQEQPEAVFLPHRNYAALNAALSEGACLQGYTRVVKRGSSPLFIRSDLLQQYRCPPP